MPGGSTKVRRGGFRPSVASPAGFLPAEDADAVQRSPIVMRPSVGLRSPLPDRRRPSRAAVPPPRCGVMPAAESPAVGLAVVAAWGRRRAGPPAPLRPHGFSGGLAGPGTMWWGRSAARSWSVGVGGERERGRRGAVPGAGGGPPARWAGRAPCLPGRRRRASCPPHRSVSRGRGSIASDVRGGGPAGPRRPGGAALSGGRRGRRRRGRHRAATPG